MKALPRLDIFKVRQLKGAPRTTQDTIEPGGGERFGPKILQIPGQEKGYFVVIFVLQQRRQQQGGREGGNGPNKRRMPEPGVTARCRQLITGGQDSSIQGALPGWKVLEHFTKAFVCTINLEQATQWFL